ncbi:MAG: cytochrome c oxidase assembly protein [Alphaproteobacteria bacterium]
MPEANQKNRRTALWATGIIFGMVGMSFAAVPLYDLFCRVTGYGGTPQVADYAPDQVFDREVRVRFNADQAKDLPWYFEPVEHYVDVNVGENRLAFYKAHNEAEEPVTGMAVFNVTPSKAGIYFSKIDCFCFVQQTLAPGQEVDMPVSFFIDPEFMTDPNMDDVTSITLSYTFYNQTEETPESTALLDVR